MLGILDIPLYDDGLARLGFRFAHNVFFLALVAGIAWRRRQPNGRDREFAFATVMLNITVFFVCFTMQKLELSLGMALGLFAIFGVLRYRSDTIRTRDMTYLFIVIGIAVVNALTSSQTSYLEILAVNSTFVVATALSEWAIGRLWGPKSADDAGENGESAGGGASGKRRKQVIEYDRLELLAPERREELIGDLRERTHLPIDRVRINRIDLPKAQASLSAWYNEDPSSAE
ncbi:MAG: DUF4956 domain-containing protein [Phycisphaerales bacterium]